MKRKRRMRKPQCDVLKRWRTPQFKRPSSISALGDELLANDDNLKLQEKQKEIDICNFPFHRISCPQIILQNVYCSCWSNVRKFGTYKDTNN